MKRRRLFDMLLRMSRPGGWLDRLSEEESGRKIELYTTECALIIYTSNWLEEEGPFAPVCTKTQSQPPSTIPSVWNPATSPIPSTVPPTPLTLLLWMSPSIIRPFWSFRRFEMSCDKKGDQILMVHLCWFFTKLFCFLWTSRKSRFNRFDLKKQKILSFLYCFILSVCNKIL